MAIQFKDSAILFGDSDGNNTDKIAFHADCCCLPIWNECEICDGDAPLEWSVTLAGITDQDCSECDPDLNDTFIVGNGDAQASFCSWRFTFTPYLCTGTDPITSLQVWVTFSGGNGRLDVMLMQAGGMLHRWRKTWTGTKVPCSTLSGESIPHDTDGSDNCNTGSSTCLVSA